jgi:hypothetical protein
MTLPTPVPLPHPQTKTEAHRWESPSRSGEVRATTRRGPHRGIRRRVWDQCYVPVDDYQQAGYSTPGGCRRHPCHRKGECGAMRSTSAGPDLASDHAFAADAYVWDTLGSWEFNQRHCIPGLGDTEYLHCAAITVVMQMTTPTTMMAGTTNLLEICPRCNLV